MENTEKNSSNRAHDQETQTNFELNSSEAVNGTLVPRRPVPGGDVRTPRGFTFRHSPSWGGRHSHNPPTAYPDFFPYDAPYATAMPPPPPVPHGHYFPNRGLPWHHHSSPISPPPSHMMSHTPYHRYGYPQMPLVPSAMASIHDPRHMETDIARPRAEWPPGYRPISKPPMPSDYLAAVHQGMGSEFGGPPSTATSFRSTVLDFSTFQNLSSPRTSARMNRKRALSNTPSSVESIDLNALIRNSPDSLLGYLNGTRLSSAGSFGHLSPGPFCTSPGSRQGVPHYPCYKTNPFITPPPIPQLTSPKPPHMTDALPSSTTGAEGVKEEAPDECTTTGTTSPQVPSKKEAETAKDNSMDMCPLDSTTSPGTSDAKTVHGTSDNEVEEEGEQDLSCHWKDCSCCTETQEDLVKHVNVDHIKKEKKDFTCYWEACSREQKPFKAQYMLVVHMRRHTGEKPHKCTYTGCPKAYSRLENLKTHLRSHTGERPYVCEVEGCQKAFSNASDRAKHQNRTHSSVKPYVCKVPGCPKRYTDPSSLRKHTKTVHGEQGIKRLKSEGSRDRPVHNQERKKPVSSGKDMGHQLSSTSQTTSHSTHQSQRKSPGRESGSTGGAPGSGGHSHGMNSCDSDLVSSSCDTAPGSLDIPGNQDIRGSVTLSTSHPALSPRSPSSYVNHLPDILEGEWEPASDRDVAAGQAVATQAQSQSVALPKIETHCRDVAKWVNDVHRRMSETSRRSSEASHLSVDGAGDASRRSSESGYNDSRRSSQASPFPGTNLQSSERTLPMLAPHPPNAPPSQYGISPQSNRPNLHAFDGNDASLRRGSEVSTCSNYSSTHNRLSRNSSGYGSQSNLAVIRSPIFHKISPPAGSSTLFRNVHGYSSNRRQSDTVICEADSSGSYSKDGKVEMRRSSEPAQHFLGIPSTNQGPPVENFNATGMQERELISHDFDPNVDRTELDAYLSPQQTEETSPNSQVLLAPARAAVPLQTQPLRHYPYTVEEMQYNQLQPRQEATSQTIHHRPNPAMHSLPHGQNGRALHQHIHSQTMPSGNQFQVQHPMQPNLWHQQGQLQQRLWSFQQQQQQQEAQENYPQPVYPDQAYMDPGYMHQPEGYKRLPGDGTSANFDSVVSGMGALSTDTNRAAGQDFLGNGNMVVSDMNTLLTSLIEEDKYLEMTQNPSRGMPGSTMSIF